MTDTHYSWHLIPSVLYQRLCRVLWGFFLFVAFTYASNGYGIGALVIVTMATLGYYLVSKHHGVSTIHFHAGLWQIDGHHLKNLQSLRAIPYGFVVHGEELGTCKIKRFMMFCDQLSLPQEHELRWVMKQMIQR